MSEQYAFPLSREQEGWFESGMTLRDWFAGQALANSYANSASANKVAEWAYQIADEMLKKRNATE